MPRPRRRSRLTALRIKASSARPEIPRANVGQLAGLVEEHGVGAHVGLVGAEGAEVGVPADVVLGVEESDRLVVEGLGGGEVFIRVCVLGNPDLGIGPTIPILAN